MRKLPTLDPSRNAGRYRPGRLLLWASLWLWAIAGIHPTDPRVYGQTVNSNHLAGAIVVRPAAWASALENWKAYRRSQGHEIYELDAELGPAGVQAAIAQIAKAAQSPSTQSPSTPSPSTQSQETPVDASLLRAPGYVLLVGDANQGGTHPPLLPPWYRQSTAMVKFGGDQLLATDHPYGDIDGDEHPELAVGRIPADSPESLAQYLERVIAYERQLDYGTWRRDVRVVAGVGGFGALADSAIEMTTARFLSDRVPAWCDVSMTYASPNSPYCPDPFQFTHTTLEQLTAGSQFWVYIGHGHIKQLDNLRVGDQWLTILKDSQLPKSELHPRPPIAVILACYTGAFDAREDCLAEQMLLNRSGPVACISATRVTGPYGLACLASRMLDEYYVARTPTLGLVMMHAKVRMLQPDPPLDSEASRADSQMQWITGIANALSPPGHDLLQERLEHVWQMNLLGDPMLRLHHPDTLQLDAAARIMQGQSISVRGVAGQAGSVTIELTRPRDSTPRDLYRAGSFTSDPAVRQKMNDGYQQANNRVLLTETIELDRAGEFACELQTSEELLPGRYVIRVFVCGPEKCSVGSANVQVVRKRL